MSQVLLFRLEDKVMGVLAPYVRETVVLGHQSMVPGIAAVFSGLMTLRGRAVPVVHLDTLLGHVVEPYDLGLILEDGPNVLCLPVQDVIGYQRYDDLLPENDIFNPIEFNYEDVEFVSMGKLVNFITSRLNVV